MDNIQKLLLGVLSIAGAIAMLVPADVDFAATPNNASPAEGVVAPPPPASARDESDLENEDEFDPEQPQDDEDDFVIGEPSIDGNPVGTQPQENPQNGGAPNASAATNYDYGQVSIPGFNMGRANMSSMPSSAELPAQAFEEGQ